MVLAVSQLILLLLAVKNARACVKDEHFWYKIFKSILHTEKKLQSHRIFFLLFFLLSASFSRLFFLIAFDVEKMDENFAYLKKR
jgi:hypothetical protein